jgi:cell division protein FtsW
VNARCHGRHQGLVRRAAQCGALPVRDQVDVAGGRPVRLLAFDQSLVAVVGALVALGVVMVYSASVALPDNPKFANYSQMYFLQRHVLALAIGFVVALVVVQVPTGFWEKQAPAIFVVALILLVLVLVPFIGKVVNFSRRWIPLGFMNFQPSELAKLAIAMYAANYMVRRMDTRERFFRAVTPMVVAVAFVGVLLMRQPDMGAFIVVATIAMGILFLGGVNARMFFLMAVVILATLRCTCTFDDLRRERILAYLDPWNPKYAQGKGYQLTHSLIALGRGEIFGQGLGSSVEKLHYLPEAHTDFLLAVIGEELGFVGVAAVVVMFFWMTRRIFLIGRQAIALDRVYAGLFCEGIGVWMGFQAFINMGVNLGVLPTKGLTLPLMSYGGSAILMNLVAWRWCCAWTSRTEPSCAEAAHESSRDHGRGHRRAHHPGLAVAREMQGRGWSVSWLGTSHGMENQLVPKAGIPLDTIRFSGLRGKGLLHTATGGLRLLKAFWDCLALLRRRSANAVLGMGGYVCFPVADGQPAEQAADAGECRRGHPAEQQVAAARGRPRGLRLRRRCRAPGQERGGHRQPGARRDRSPARARHATPAAAARCACWWWAAAWARRFSTRPCPPRWRCCRGQRPGRHAPDRCRASRSRARRLRSRRCASHGRRLHRRDGAATGRLRPDGLPRGRHHGERTLRRRRAGHPGAADRQHHFAPARQRAVDGARTAPRCTCRKPS